MRKKDIWLNLTAYLLELRRRGGLPESEQLRLKRERAREWLEVFQLEQMFQEAERAERERIERIKARALSRVERARKG
jgi:hypothetical protein